MVALTRQEKIMFPQGHKRLGWTKYHKEHPGTYAEALARNPYAGFYRVRKQYGKTYHEKLPFYWPVDRVTVLQKKWRAIFSSAIDEWRHLSPVQKKVWQKRGYNRRIPGYNFFISNYMKTHKP